MTFDPLTILGVAFFILAMIIGWLTLVSAPVSAGKADDDRKRFFKSVEEAREAEMLEPKGVMYDLNGEWRGNGDGLFGIGRDIFLRIKLQGSEFTGEFEDQFGSSPLHGYFVWPYVWFDLERHGTVFEFRGSIEEKPDASTISGKYRYSSNDADWLVYRLQNSSRAAEAGADRDTAGGAIAEPSGESV